jgi:pyruvate/2-oxoglutarate dehydrogenase complex dihydrolipoamide dehydrogenase (E3) component
MHQPPSLQPLDAHNRTLLANVAPSDWRNPTPAGRYHLVVIGAGTAGLVTAAGAAGLGARVALVERAFLGGDCLNVGCVPSKAVLRAARTAAEVRDAGDVGVRVPSGVTIDFARAMERMRAIRAHISPNDSALRFSKQLGVDVFFGNARFLSRDTVAVDGADGAQLRFKRAVIATGARAAHPSVPGLADAGFLTNESVFSLTARPRRLAVIGGGPIGCELAQAFQRLGAQVTLFHDRDHLLDREDADAAEIVQRALVRDGVRLVLSAQLERVQRKGDEKSLTYAAAAGGGECVVDEILVGAGRVPNVDGLGLESAGIAYDARRGVRVDDRLRTTNPRVFAAGDVCMDWKFTHAADFAARIVIQNALFFGRRKLSSLTMPWCTYTEPEIAHVGLYERDAKAKGIEVTTFVRPLAEVDRALLDGEEEGFVKLLVRKGSDQIVGATIVARHAGDLISEVSVAMAGKLGLGALANVIHPYPTQAEAIRQLGDQYNRTRLTPFVKALFRRWLALTG